LAGAIGYFFASDRTSPGAVNKEQVLENNKQLPAASNVTAGQLDRCVDTLQYADVPPTGYRIADNRQTIRECDMAYWPSSDKMDAVWRLPRQGENIIGATVHEHWPVIMGVATPA
jgi:hypothetical protein